MALSTTHLTTGCEGPPQTFCPALGVGARGLGLCAPWNVLHALLLTLGPSTPPGQKTL